MKIIVDTNVIISAALRDRDPELVILFIVSHPDRFSPSIARCSCSRSLAYPQYP